MTITNNNILYLGDYCSKFSSVIQQLKDSLESCSSEDGSNEGCCSGGDSDDNQTTDEIFTTEPITIEDVVYPVGTSLQVLLEALSHQNSNGEVNTASNVGSNGVGIFKQKTFSNLEFKNINSGSNKIAIIDDILNNEIDIDVNIPNLTGISQSQVTDLVSDLSSKAPLFSPTFTGNVSGINKSMVGLGDVDNTPDINKPISTFTQIALNTKQPNLQFQDEGIDLGISGAVQKINFTGSSIVASVISDTLTVDVSGGSGNTNLSTINRTANTLDISSDTGTDATIPLATTFLAGLLTATDKTKLDGISIGANNYIHPNHTGDIVSLGDGVTTIQSGVVSNAKLASMGANTIKGTILGGTPGDLTPANVKSILAYNGSEITNTPAGNISSVNVQAALNELDLEKQANIQFQDESVLLGGAGTVNALNFTGSNVTASRIGNTVTIDITEGVGVTNLTIANNTATTLDVISDTGTDATLPAATTSLAGLMTSTDKIKLNGIAINANNYIHPNHTGEVTSTGDGSTVIVPGIVTNAKLANMPPNTIKGTIAGGVPSDLTPANAKTILAYTSSEIINTPSGNISSITVQSALNELDSEKQSKIQFQDEGVDVGSLGGITAINFTGAVISATPSGSVLNVDVTGSSGTGNTNLGYLPSSTDGTLTSDTGTDAIIPAATGVDAGLMVPSQFTKLNNISVTQSVDLDVIESDTVINNAKITNATHSGDATGSGVLTLATVNSNIGTFGSPTQVGIFTVNNKGLITSASNSPISLSASSITGGSALTKIDDTNVTITLSGSPATSLLSPVSISLGWTGTLADSRIASASAWNAKPSGNGTSGWMTKWSGTNTIAASTKIFETSDNVAIGTGTGIDSYSRLYVYGGTNGANVDVRPGGGGYSQAIIDLQSDDYATSFVSTYLRHSGATATGTIMGLTSVQLGELTYQGSNAFLIRNVNNAPIIVGVNNAEVARFLSNGLRVSSLSGTGTRMVVADNTGFISTQALPSVITPSALTKVDDTNVTLTLGGTPATALLSSASLTLGWTGQLSVSRGGTGLGILGTSLQQLRVNAGGTALEYFTPSSSGINSLNSLTAATQTFTNDTNITIVSGGSSHVITWSGTLADARIASAANWNTAYTNRITSLTTSGSSGAATLVSNVLNVPNYTLAGLGGQPLDSDLTAIASLTGISGFLKTNGAGTWSVDTATYLTTNQTVTLSGQATGSGTTAISVTLDNAAVIGKVLTGYTSGAGVITSSDSILSAIQKLNGNIAAVTSINNSEIRVVSVNTTLSATTDDTVVFDTTGTIATLPSPTNKKKLVIKNNTSTSTGVVTISGHLDGTSGATYVLKQFEAMTLHSNGTTWYILSIA